VPGRARPMRSNDQQDPETARLRQQSAPIPRSPILREEDASVKVHAKSRRDLDRGVLLPKKQTSREGGMEAYGWGLAGQTRKRGFNAGKNPRIFRLTETAFS
jgi:hypothetical protein